MFCYENKKTLAHAFIFLFVRYQLFNDEYYDIFISIKETGKK